MCMCFPLQTQLFVPEAKVLVFLIILSSQDSATGIVPGLWTAQPKNRGYIPGESKTFSSPNRPDPLWGPVSLAFIRSLGFFNRQ